MFSYAAGNYTGYGFVSDQCQLLCSTMSYARVLRVWEMLSDGAPFEEVLTELMEANVADFVAAELTDASTAAMYCVAYGNSAIHIDGALALAGNRTGEPCECDVDGVYDMTLRVGDMPETGIRLPMRRGIVRTHQLFWGKAAELEAPPILASPRTQQIALPQIPDQTRHDTSPLFESDLVLAPDLGPRPSAPRPRYELIFDSGEATFLGDITVGRNPLPPEGTDSHPFQLVSPRNTVSGTHARIYLALAENGADEIVVLDLGSTNGTRVHRKDGSTERLAPGSFAIITVGDRVDFGDGNIATLAVS